MNVENNILIVLKCVVEHDKKHMVIYENINKLKI